LIEVLVVIAILMLLASMIGVPTRRDKEKAQRINCVNNLKQIGLAYRIWSDDHGGKYPMELSTTNGGTMELIGTTDAWRTYQVMSNELSTTKLLFCPADEERQMYATNFSTDLKGKISYFIGVDAVPDQPHAFLSGDDNFATAGQPVKSGLISLASNAPVAWTTARHHLVGNIGLADGSVLTLNNSTIASWLRQTGLATNRLAIP